MPLNEEEIEKAQDIAWAIMTADERVYLHGWPVADIVEGDDALEG
jgi:hypothetical protein